MELSVPFSPGRLAGAGRSLCLLIERFQTSSVRGQLCVAGPRRPAFAKLHLPQLVG